MAVSPSDRGGFVGPLFRWELVRLARRGQDTRARFMLAAGLLIGLTLFTIVWFQHVPLRDLFFGTSQYLSLQESATFGESFSIAFIVTQLGVLVLLTPAYAAGGIAEEKDRRTFDFLLVSRLSNREIVFGKFLGRLCFLLGVLAAGLPVLALTQVYGGVSITFLLLGYLLTATTVIFLAAVGVAAAAFAETFRGAMFRSYAIAGFHLLSGCGLHPILGPFGILGIVYTALGEGAGPTPAIVVALLYSGAQLIAAIVALGYAFRGVRRLRSRIVHPTKNSSSERRRKRPDNNLPIPVAQPIRRVFTSKERDPFPAPIRPPVDEYDPFGWKERHVRGVSRDDDDESIRGLQFAGGLTISLLIGFYVLVAVLMLVTTGAERSGLESIQRLLLFGGSTCWCCYLVVLGTTACGTICRERVRQTLESLLAIPVPRAAILQAKREACLRHGIWWGVPTGLCVIGAIMLTDSPLLAIPIAAYHLAARQFVVEFGIWLSIRAQTVTRAVMFYLPAAGLMVMGPVIVWLFADADYWKLVFVVICGVLMLIAIAAAWFRTAGNHDFERLDSF